MVCIDTHVHFWKYNKERDAWITDDMKLLRQHYLPEQLTLTLKRNEVDGVVAIQVEQSEVETAFLVELAKTHDMIRGVVGWVDLRSENLNERLDFFSQFPIIKGWRHIVQGESNEFLLREDFQRGIRELGLRNYTYDILIYHYQLEPALEFVSKFPEQKLVIDHCAKPDIRLGEISEWKKRMQELSRASNVYCKLSGLFTEAKWSAWKPGEFYPYLDAVFDCFGVNRLMFGSDWPVLLLSGMYVQWKSLLEKYMENYKREEKEKVFGRNAIEFYGLEVKKK
jgi:L-fuconolactonase